MMEQGSPEWFEARLGRVTASRISDVMMSPTTKGYQNYRAELVCERLTGEPVEKYVSAAMLHGTETEPQARAFYELETGLDVIQTGFITHPSIAMSGASPDGLIGSDGGLEIKCPQMSNHIKILTGGEIDDAYMLQMQWGMECTDREWWDFVSFCPSFPCELQMHRQRIRRDDPLIEKIRAKVTTILEEVDDLEIRLSHKMQEAA